MTDREPPSFDHLIPELREWTPQESFRPEFWISAVGNYELAIGYSLIFWPRFVVIDDYVLRAGATEGNLRHWEEATGKDRRAIEAVINHVHMIDLHDTPAEPTEDQLRFLGRTLRQTHEAKLALDFPERQFEVSFPDEPGLDIYDYELTFWQKG